MTPTGGDKPYRVYRGGRVKGKVPLPTRPSPAEAGPDGRVDYRGPRPKPKRRPWGRWIGVALGLLFLLFVAWAVASYFAFRSGVAAANKRLDKATKRALVPEEGLLLSRPTNILLLGTDHAQTEARLTNRHSDSILLLRTDPDRHRLAYLSILRDLRVEIPGHGTGKINAAFQVGGPALAARTVQAVTGMAVNHVVIVDFGNFRQLIDELGGITVDVPAPILSNRFDCPFPTAERCSSWQGWRFAKGKQHMDGRRALVYSRIRENRLNRSESDATRARRQQQVLQAITDKLTSPGTLARMPFMGDDLLKPVATDLSAEQFLQLGWVKFRAGRSVRCRLGGTPFGGYILADEERFAVIRMVKGRTAEQPPLPNSLYGSGCGGSAGAGL
jgi:polyisoprenyl-teichoic acid--peptidoglycan teichoic acid transferase